MFTPLRFQSSLAAGGLALMPFVLMQLTFPHAGKLITVHDVGSAGLDVGRMSLVAVMAVATIFHLALTFSSTRGLAIWLADRRSAREFISDPKKNSAIFSPAISLGMTINVLLGPVAFFVTTGGWSTAPQLASFAFFIYVLLWAALAGLSAFAVRTWFSRPLASTDLNFVWLLDVFAWAMAALAGSSIAAASSSALVATLATVLTVASAAVGLAIYAVKGALLLSALLRQRSLPADSLQPAFFVTVPINCLFGVAAFKVSRPFDHLMGTHTSGVALSALLVLFAAAAVWTVGCAIAVRGWFLRAFPRPDFYPTQWGLVCLFVGLEVLALYTHANYAPHPLWISFAYASTAAATGVYALVFAKFAGMYTARPVAVPSRPTV
jgi:hypothetical protein